jgi:hypothetical protein
MSTFKNKYFLMKRKKIIYWTSTTLVALGVITSGFLYFTSPMMIAEFKHFGFPYYFRMELGTAKIFGGFALLLPMIPSKIKEWAYAGLGITFISAIIAHSAVGDGFATLIGPFFFLFLLIVSYLNCEKTNGTQLQS